MSAAHASRTRVPPARRRRLRQGLPAVLAPALLGLAVALAVASSEVLDQLEHATLKARFDLRGNQPPPADVVIVALDDDSLRELKVAPPGPRPLHARLLNVLSAAKPRVIADDFTFFRRRSDREDAPLRDAVGQAGPIVLAAATVYKDGETLVLGSTATVEKLGGEVGVALIRRMANVYYDRVTETATGIPTFAYLAARLAGARPD